MQSYGFGGSAQAPGSTNAGGLTISLGGFDTYFSLFRGVGPGATFLQSNDDGDCPPGDGTFGCFDSTLTGPLSAGSYTLAVGVFENLSFAENLGVGTLGDGFIGLGNYGFNTSDYAVDITVAADPTAVRLIDAHRLSDVPEPASVALLAAVFLGLGMKVCRLRNSAAAKELR